MTDDEHAEFERYFRESLPQLAGQLDRLPDRGVATRQRWRAALADCQVQHAWDAIDAMVAGDLARPFLDEFPAAVRGYCRRRAIQEAPAEYQEPSEYERVISGTVSSGDFSMGGVLRALLDGRPIGELIPAAHDDPRDAYRCPECRDEGLRYVWSSVARLAVERGVFDLRKHSIQAVVACTCSRGNRRMEIKNRKGENFLTPFDGRVHCDFDTPPDDFKEFATNIKFPGYVDAFDEWNRRGETQGELL